MYAKSVLFHGAVGGGEDLFDLARDQRMPFGTKRQADEVVRVDDFADFSVTLADHAPPGATGRVQLTYLMQNTGPETRVVIETTNADGTTTPPDAGGAAGAGGKAAASGGAAGVGGASSASGSAANTAGSATGGTLGTSPASAGSAGNTAAPAPASSGSSCACQLPGRAPASSAAGCLLALLLGVSRRRRFSRRPPRAREPRCPA